MNRWIAATIAVSAVTISAPALAQDAEGSWGGTLEVGGMEMPVMVHIARGEDGTLSGTADNPAQGITGIPITNVVNEAGRFSFSVPAAEGLYTSRWDAASESWLGTWSQGGQFFPVNLSAIRRGNPQESAVPVTQD